MARRFPHSQITAMSNSSDQKRYVDYFMLTNVTVITANIETFNPQQALIVLFLLKCSNIYPTINVYSIR